MRWIKKILKDRRNNQQSMMRNIHSEENLKFSLRTEGYCPICEQETIFMSDSPWLRDHYKCCSCKSIPRWRAFIQVLHTHFPAWREMSIHEFSPGGAASNKLRNECVKYSYSYFFDNVKTGTMYEGHRCENIEACTFENSTFDMVITQDVLEHVFEADKAFSEIERI